MEDCCVREKTVKEELKDLDIDKNIKKRIIERWDNLLNENTKQSNYLFNCHNEIDKLNKAIISQAKRIASLEETIRNIGGVK